MTEKILVIKGKGGLGNCILSAICGLVFADLTGRRPLIDWRDGSYAPIGRNAYPLLFKAPITQDMSAIDNYADPISPPIWNNHINYTAQEMIEKFAPDSHSNPIGYRRLCTDLHHLDAPENLAVFWSYLPKFGRLARHLHRDPRFSNRLQQDIISEYLERYFTPNDRVLSEVDKINTEFGTPKIGVHIRYTDLKIPLHRIKKALRKRLRTTPNATVFLATDNAQIQAEMAAEFKGIRHITKHLPKDGTRLHWPTSDIEKLQEAENALIDMWLLSRCDHLIYSRHSTFSVTSSYLGRMQPEQMDDVDRFSPRIVAKRFIQSYV